MTAHATCVHPRTATARRACRQASTRRDVLKPLIQAALEASYVAATRENEEYDHAEYERTWRVASGLIIAFTDGDVAYAKAIEDSWVECNEFLGSTYMTWDRDVLVYEARTWLDDAERDALEAKLFPEDA